MTSSHLTRISTLAGFLRRAQLCPGRRLAPYPRPLECVTPGPIPQAALQSHPNPPPNPPQHLAFSYSFCPAVKKHPSCQGLPEFSSNHLSAFEAENVHPLLLFLLRLILLFQKVPSLCSSLFPYSSLEFGTPNTILILYTISYTPDNVTLIS